jgi:AcrR family transcriptional regulator
MKRLGRPAPPPPDPFARLRTNAPQQARSRETLARLLAAAEELLEEGGVDAATVPAIAERAGVSVGVVYRRFPDKDTMLRAVYERFFIRLREQNRNGIEALTRMRLPLLALARTVITGMVEGYRRRRALLRALTRFARAHPDAAFRRAAQELNREATTATTALFLADAKRIRHPRPEEAVQFALLSIASILHTVIIEEDPLHGLTAPPDLEGELLRLFTSYLGITTTRK